MNAGRVISPDAALKKVLPVAKVDMLKVSDFLTELPCVAADIFSGCSSVEYYSPILGIH